MNETDAGFRILLTDNASDCGEQNADAIGRFFASSIVSRIDFHHRMLEITGRKDGGESWRLTVTGSARFTFSNDGKNGRWLIEANFDAGGHVRSAERNAILAACGASIDHFRLDDEGLFLNSDDGRAIEMPFALNEQGLAFEAFPAN